MVSLLGFLMNSLKLLDKTAGDLDVPMAGLVADAGGWVFAEADRAREKACGRKASRRMAYHFACDGERTKKKAAS